MSEPVLCPACQQANVLPYAVDKGVGSIGDIAHYSCPRCGKLWGERVKEAPNLQP